MLLTGQLEEEKEKVCDENEDAPVGTTETQGLTRDHRAQLYTEELAERQEMGKFPDHTNCQNESLNTQKA